MHTDRLQSRNSELYFFLPFLSWLIRQARKTFSHHQWKNIKQTHAPNYLPWYFLETNKYQVLPSTNSQWPGSKCLMSWKMSFLELEMTSSKWIILPIWSIISKVLHVESSDEGLLRCIGTLTPKPLSSSSFCQNKTIKTKLQTKRLNQIGVVLFSPNKIII